MDERANVSATPAGSGKQSTFTYNWAEALDEYTQFPRFSGLRFQIIIYSHQPV
jgi:hypothetical protein